MNNAVTGAITALASQALAALGTLNPVAKAATAAAVPFVGSLVNMAVSGKFNVTSVVLCGVAVASAVLTYLVPNRPKPAPATPAGK